MYVCRPTTHVLVSTHGNHQRILIRSVCLPHLTTHTRTREGLSVCLSDLIGLCVDLTCLTDHHSTLKVHLHDTQEEVHHVWVCVSVADLCSSTLDLVSLLSSYVISWSFDRGSYETTRSLCHTPAQHTTHTDRSYLPVMLAPCCVCLSSPPSFHLQVIFWLTYA